MKPILTLYAVRIKTGEYFPAKGVYYVDDISKARIYTKLSQARTRCTMIATNDPASGVPEIIELYVTETCAVNQEVRFAKFKEKKAKAEEKREARFNEWKFKQAEENLKKAQEELKKLSENQKRITE